ncbi:UNVERIFIED_CONTAM: hypothetical protein K2H54_048674 [Gekko kuhli]
MRINRKRISKLCRGLNILQDTHDHEVMDIMDINLTVHRGILSSAAQPVLKKSPCVVIQKICCVSTGLPSLCPHFAEMAGVRGEVHEEQDLPKEQVVPEVEGCDDTQLNLMDELDVGPRTDSPGGNHSDTNERDPDDIPPGSAMVDLSPASRMALKKSRQKRVSALNRVGDMMLRQSSREHLAMMEHVSRQHGEILAEMRAAREEDIIQSKAICSLFRETMTAIVGMSTSVTRVPERTQAPDTQPISEINLPNLATGVIISTDLSDNCDLETVGGVEIHALLDMDEPQREPVPLPNFPISTSPPNGPPVHVERPKRIIKKKKILSR